MDALAAAARQTMVDLPLRVLLYRDGQDHVAVALEHHVVVRASTRAGLVDAFVTAVTSLILNDLSTGTRPLLDLPPAPARLFRRYRDAAPDTRLFAGHPSFQVRDASPRTIYLVQG